MAGQRDATEFRKMLRRELPGLRARYDVDSLGVFGSYVRGEADSGSDLDVLVRFHRNPGLFRFVELENYLSDILGMRVDPVMAEALKPNIGRQVLAEVEPV